MNTLILVFNRIWEISLTASVIIPAVLIVRCILLRFPKKYSYRLWLVVLFRLLCPVAVNSIFSIYNLFSYWMVNLPSVLKNDLFPSEAVVLPDEQLTTTAIPDHSGAIASEQITHTYIPAEASYIPTEIVIPDWWKIAALVWLTGIGLIAAYSLYQYVTLHKQVKKATLLSSNAYECENISSPFVIGLFSPRIYLPYRLEKEKQEFILAHERCHIKRGDHLIKLLAFLALCLHWFNPLVWFSWFFLQRDMEMSCDEKVISLLGNEIKKEYSTLLLSFSSNQRMNPGGPLAFDESDTGKRIKNILRFHPPGRLASILGTVLLVVAILGFGTDEISVSDGILLTNSGQDALASEETYVIRDTSNAVPGTDSSTTSDYMASILITDPTIDLNASTGADGALVYYADEHQIIFGGYFGLFVYSKDEERLIRSMDLAPIGCNFTQGDNYCEISVSADGKKVYLHPVNLDSMYVYEVADHSLIEIAYDMTEVNLYDGLSPEGHAAYMTAEGQTYDPIFGQYGTLGEIGYVDENGLVHKLLVPPLYTDTVYFEPEDIQNLVMAEMAYGGKIYRTTNKEALAYIEKHFSAATPIKSEDDCPFYDKLYLTRADGTVGIVYPATDSCATFRTPGGDYNYSTEDSSKFWSFFPGSLILLQQTAR